MVYSGATVNLHSSVIKICDGLTIIGLFYISFLIRNLEITTKDINLIMLALLVFYLLGNFFNLYSTHSLNAASLSFKKILNVWLGVCFIIITWLFGNKVSEEFSRIVIFSWMFAVPVVLILNRKLSHLIIFNRHKNLSIAVVGNNETSQHFITHLKAQKWPWVTVYGLYDFIPVTQSAPLTIKPITELISHIKANHVNTVYIALTLYKETEIKQLLLDLADTTISVYIIPDQFVTNIMKSTWSQIAGLSVVNVYSVPIEGANRLIKRLFDISFSLLALLVISPIMLMIAIAIKLTSKGPILFTQRRYGLDGNIINVWKFRSMTVTEDGAHIRQAQKNDVRVTPLGRFLRKTSLDELPQFFNVLQGSLSVVGPRPHANAHNEEYRQQIKGYMLRHKVKPGITGLAQINGWRGETDTLLKMEKRVEYDIEYIQNWSLFLDIKIIFLTVFKGFVDKNAY